jgi:tripartite-type tricarboxylate transporter receptor subunit TctC
MEEEMRQVKHAFAVLLAALIVFSSAAHGQSYPNKPVTIVVPSAPGGLIDVLCRAIGESLGQVFKERFIVENKAGASLIIGTQYVARSAPDGYTLLGNTVGPISAYPFLYGKLPYNPQKDLTPVAMLVFASQIFVVPSNLPVRSLREFIQYANANAGKLNYGSVGMGSSSHLLMALLANTAGIDMAHIAYKGNAPAQLAMMAGEVQSAFLSMQGPLPLIRSGRLNALAIGAPQRSALLPNVPTMDESGFPGFTNQVWFALFAPAGTPAEIVTSLNAEINKLLNDAQFREKWISSQGLDAAPMTVSQFADFLRTNREEVQRMVKISGAKIE